MFPQDQFKLTRQAMILAMISAAFPAAAWGAAAGRVDFAIGEVSATAPDGKVRALAKGAEINQGDTLNTGANGRAQVRFSDGAYSSFQPRSEFKIDQYHFEGKSDGEEKGFFSLLKGGLRTITGAIGRANRKAYQVATPTATIGIRGTEYVAQLGNSLNVSVGEGLIEVCNAGGCLLIREGESAYVKDAGTTPVFTFQRAEAGPTSPSHGTPDEFRTAEDRDSGGGAVFLPTLPSGSGYDLVAGGGFVYDGGERSDFIHDPLYDGEASFDGPDLVSYADGGEGSSFSGVVAGGFTDGVIGWGRWTSGTHVDCYSPCGDPRGLQDVHYVVGQPTPYEDMNNLEYDGMVGTYSLIGFTFPTAFNSYTGERTVGTERVTGSLEADFGEGYVWMSLGVPIGGQSFQLEGSGGISSNAHFSGELYEYGDMAGSAGFDGMFVGANASRAGAVYQFNDYSDANLGTVTGAVTFRQTGLTEGGGCCVC